MSFPKIFSSSPMEAVGPPSNPVEDQKPRFDLAWISSCPTSVMSKYPENGAPGPVINRTELVHAEKWICLKKHHWTDQKGRNRVRSAFEPFYEGCRPLLHEKVF